MPQLLKTHAQRRLAPSLEAACARFSGRPALTHGALTLTYSELWERVLALAWSYRELGIGPGERILCQLPPCPEHLISIGAAWACGAVHVGAHPELTGAELSTLVSRTGARALVYAPAPTAPEPWAALAGVRAAHPSLRAIVHGPEEQPGAVRLERLLARAPRERRPPVPSGPEDAALLVLTSGTTGTPKAVIETLPALWGKLELFASGLEPTPEDVHLGYLPLCHIYGLKLTLMALASGGRVALLDRFSPAPALALAARERVSVLPGTPTHLTLLLRTFERQPDALAGVRAVAFAAAPPPPALIEALYARLGARLMHVYGCSEGFVVLSTDPAEIRRAAAGRTVFRGPPGTPPDGRVAILDPDGAVPLAPGEVGEIAFGIRCPVRYWDAPAGGADGWYRTGDLGWLDGDGCLTVSGRLRDIINRGGLKVACAELDAALGSLPGIAEAAVIAAPDSVLGEAICACVVPGGERPPDLGGLRSALGPTLARHKLPDELCLLESLPRTRMGKLDRAALRELVFGRELARERLRGPARSRPAG
jgi:acyl-CoA synthetase (AMP-forming)/AMP-acid ligase II